MQIERSKIHPSMVMSHNLHSNFGNWCIFPENEPIYQGKWLKPQIVCGGEIMMIMIVSMRIEDNLQTFKVDDILALVTLRAHLCLK